MDSVASSVVDETAPRTAIRISDVVEVKDVGFVDEFHEPGLPNCSRTLSCPGKVKNRRISDGSFVPKRKSTYASPSGARSGSQKDPSFGAALEKKT